MAARTATLRVAARAPTPAGPLRLAVVWFNRLSVSLALQRTLRARRSEPRCWLPRHARATSCDSEQPLWRPAPHRRPPRTLTRLLACSRAQAAAAAAQAALHAAEERAQSHLAMSAPLARQRPLRAHLLAPGGCRAERKRAPHAPLAASRESLQLLLAPPRNRHSFCLNLSTSQLPVVA